MAEHLSSEIDEVCTSLDNIKTKSDAFKDLEEGTAEWY
jgi:hypothetical protein